MNHESIFFVLVDLLLKGVGVVTVGAAGVWILKRRSAAKWNAIWSTTFLALLLLPVTIAVAPRWSWISLQQEQSSPRSDKAETLVVDGVQFTEPQADEPIPIGSLSPEWRSVLVAVWCAGSLVFLMRRLLGSFQLWKLKRHSISPPVRIVALARETEREYCLKSPAAVFLAEGQMMPLTWGILHPVIMLPVEAVEWNEELLRMVLRHEYAHVRRRDSLFRLVAQLACALHWPNPLVWSAARKLRLSQEHAADDLVLQAGVVSARYADELVTAVRRFLHGANGANHALAMAQPSTLGARVDAVLDNARDRRSLDRPQFVGCIVAIIVTLVTSGAAQVATSKAAPASSNRADSQLSPPKPALSGSSVDNAGSPASANSPAPTKTNSETAPKPSSAAAQKTQFSDYPIEINAEETRFEGGIAVAEGTAELKYRAITITADTIRYNPATRSATAIGNANIIREDGRKTTSPKAAIEYNLETDVMKISELPVRRQL